MKCLTEESVKKYVYGGAVLGGGGGGNIKNLSLIHI